jgi:hypothetical protein
LYVKVKIINIDRGPSEPRAALNHQNFEIRVLPSDAMPPVFRTVPGVEQRVSIPVGPEYRDSVEYQVNPPLSSYRPVCPGRIPYCTNLGEKYEVVKSAGCQGTIREGQVRTCEIIIFDIPRQSSTLILRTVYTHTPLNYLPPQFETPRGFTFPLEGVAGEYIAGRHFVVSPGAGTAINFNPGEFMIDLDPRANSLFNMRVQENGCYLAISGNRIWLHGRVAAYEARTCTFVLTPKN